MALRSLTTRMWRGPAAAYALRRHPDPGVPPPQALSRFLGTTCSQSKPHSKRIQQEAVSVLEQIYLMVEMENLITASKQRLVELDELRRQKKRILKLCGFTLAGLASMTVYEANQATLFEANQLAAEIAAQGTFP